jgi:hypothetical protein
MILLNKALRKSALTLAIAIAGIGHIHVYSPMELQITKIRVKNPEVLGLSLSRGR